MAESCSNLTLTDQPIMPMPSAFAPGSSSSSPSVQPADFDDALEDVCSICLECFSTSDPAIVTTCKHEYHLHCILDWSQRSKECPICWQSLALMDPSSQELLAAVQTERSSQPRRFASSRSGLPFYSNDAYETEYEPPYTGGSDFSEHILQRVSAAMSRARYVVRNQRQSSLEPGSSEYHAFPSQSMSNGMQMHTNSPEECPSSNVSSGYSSPSSCISPGSTSLLTPVIHTPCDTDFSRDALRSFSSQSLSNESQRPSPPEMFAFSDSIKSKLSAASAKYKHSFSKGTLGLKENFKDKFSINNSSVKELGKGVQREMTAGIAGLTKLIDRLEIKSKRGSQIFNEVQRPFDIFSKGKQVQEDAENDPPTSGHQIKREEGLCLGKHTFQSPH